MRICAANLLCAAIAIAQPSFEVASIKLNISGDRSSFTRRGEDSLALQNWPLRNIVLRAYDLKNYALNAPDWLASRNFDINAKASGKVNEKELRQMLQSLLRDRFQMKVHPATKELQAYVLLPAKGGLKVKPVHDNGVFGVDVSHFPDKTIVACRHCTMEARKCPRRPCEPCCHRSIQHSGGILFQARMESRPKRGRRRTVHLHRAEGTTRYAARIPQAARFDFGGR